MRCRALTDTNVLSHGSPVAMRRGFCRCLGGDMSETSDLDAALIRVHRVEMDADSNNDETTVNACQIVLDKLLETRANLPLQRVCAEIPAFRSVTPKQ